MILMTLVEEELNEKAADGLSLKDRLQSGSPDARNQALSLLDKKPAAGLSANEWSNLGLESAIRTVQMVKNLVTDQS